MAGYPPRYHLEQDLEKIHNTIRTYDFATIITRPENSDGVHISQIPLILDTSRGEHGVLIGHMHGANPQIDDLKDNKPVTAMFTGPHAYISPMDYSSDQLPTWNYITVHALGTTRQIEGHDAMYDLMMRMVNYYEDRRPAEAEKFVLARDHKKANAVLKLLHCFEIDIMELIGRFKLSQDKNALDVDLARQKLIEATEETQTPFIELMYEAAID